MPRYHCLVIGFEHSTRVRAEQLPEADLVVGFEQYGGLPSAIRKSLGLDPEVNVEEYSQKSRVQVLGIP